MSKDRKRKRLMATGKYQEQPNYFMRLWYTSTNTYSTTFHVNNAQLYRYSDAEKALFRSGTVLSLKDGNETVGAVVLARGDFNKMEALTGYLESLADEKCDTGEVLRRVDQKVLNDEYGACSKGKEQSADTDCIESDSDVNLPQKTAQSEILVKERKKQEELMRSFKKKASTHRRMDSFSGTSLASKEHVPTSHMVLAELRLHTTMLRAFRDELRELNTSLRHLRETEAELPKEDDIYEGIQGSFTLSSIGSSNPNVFARSFLRKTHSLKHLSNMILCPKGKTSRSEFSAGDIEHLQSALQKWYGSSYSWKSVVLSVNQFLREIKVTDLDKDTM